ncbi:EamA family transporter [Candidatus Woesearchaeota archaeon]|nr:EamA family transporter [Candidatus Woesearchaeota archaeon]
MKPTKSIILATVLVASGHLLVKYGLNQLGEISFSNGIFAAFMTIFSSWHVLLGIALFGGSSILWLTSISKTDLSYAVPFLSLSYALVTLFSWLLLAEQLSFTRFLGVGIICTGVVLMARS